MHLEFTTYCRTNNRASASQLESDLRVFREPLLVDLDEDEDEENELPLIELPENANADSLPLITDIFAKSRFHKAFHF